MNVAEEFRLTIAENYYLLRSAQEAFKSFLNAYAGHSLKQIFDLSRINLDKLAASFGLSSVPRVD